MSEITVVEEIKREIQKGIDEYRIFFERSDLPKIQKRSYDRGFRDGCSRTMEDVSDAPWYCRLFNKFN